MSTDLDRRTPMSPNEHRCARPQVVVISVGVPRVPRDDDFGRPPEKLTKNNFSPANHIRKYGFSGHKFSKKFSQA